MSVFSDLALDYPLLYLNPDTDSQETYCSVVLRGEEPPSHSLDHYTGSDADRLDTADTPAGKVRVVTIGNRRDFELVIRGLMAAKNGPLSPVPETEGAAMIYVFNWRRIKTHLAVFPEEEQNAEFKRFTSVRENYLDMLVVLSRGPYSGIDAASAGFAADEWLDYSDTIRRYHELTHVICRRMYPDNIGKVRDELVADAVGLLAAFGHVDPDLEKLFLGIRDRQYTDGRLAVYTETPDEVTGQVCEKLDRIVELVDKQSWDSPYDPIPVLMEAIPPF